MILRVNVVLNRTESIVVDSDWRFNNLCGSHLQSQRGLYHVSYGILFTVPSLPNHCAFDKNPWEKQYAVSRKIATTIFFYYMIPIIGTQIMENSNKVVSRP